MAKKRYKLSYAKQIALLNAYFENGISCISHNGFVWKCSITPTPNSNTYILKIKYKDGGRPLSYIVSPKPLPLAKGAKTLPHVYDNELQRLCLYHPALNEWDPSKPIATTIVHWAILWMFYYEIWLYTGKWEGGGHGNWDTEYDDK